jgi:hypothetical protein
MILAKKNNFQGILNEPDVPLFGGNRRNWEPEKKTGNHKLTFHQKGGCKQ